MEDEEHMVSIVPETTEGYKQMNTNKPIWLFPPSNDSTEEYNSFYQSTFNVMYDMYLVHTHFSWGGVW